MADFPTTLRQLRELGPQQWAEHGLRVAPVVVASLLVIALAWQLAQLTWLFLGAAPGNPSPIAAAPTSFRSGPGQTIDLQRIVDAHLFGVASDKPAPDVSNAPQTRMNLVLAGTMAGTDPQTGYAIVGESAATAKTYPTGATVRPGTRLHSVYTDRVILDNSGRLETLALPRQSSITAPIAPLTMTGNPGGGVGDNLRRIAETNPSAFSAVVRPQPVFANGVQRGYRVYAGRDRRRFSQLGLQPGDLILSINGTPLDDPARGPEILSSLNSASQVNVTLERSGQIQQLTLNTAQLTLPDPAQPDVGTDAPQDVTTGDPATSEPAVLAQ